MSHFVGKSHTRLAGSRGTSALQPVLASLVYGAAVQGVDAHIGSTTFMTESLIAACSKGNKGTQMGAINDESEASDERDTNKPIFLSIGIALFVTGFVMTVVFSTAGSIGGKVSSTEDHALSESRSLSEFENLMVLLGIFLGLLGVVTATIGPLTTVVMKKGSR